MQVNLNKLFKYLSIRTKLLIAFVGLSIIPLIIVGVYGAYSSIKSLRRVIVENIKHDVQLVRRNLENFINEVGKDIFYLRSSYALKRYLLNPGKETKFELEREILAFLKTKGIYYEVKLLDRFGDELFKIEKIKGDYVAVPEEKLLKGRGTYYRLLISSLRYNQISFAPAELLSLDGRLVPVITCAVPVYVKNRFSGILVVDVFASEVFKVIESNPHHYAGKTIVVNEQGYYLYHSEKKKNWNRLLASRDIDNLLKSYPTKIYFKIISGAESLIDYKGQIIFTAPLFTRSSPLADKYVILRVAPKSLIFSSVYNFSLFFILILAFFLGLSSVLAIVAAGQLTKPIKELKRGAQVIASGNYGFRLNIETNDEIEELANEFNRMAKMLERHEKEIEMHRNHLEELVVRRTKELVEEKQKLQSILDNVPSAFLLIDKNHRIISASSAVKFLTNCGSPQEVVGKYCYDCFSDFEFCRKCDVEEIMKTGKSSIRLHKVKDRYFEVSMIPIFRDGEISAVLEVITDVTERKKAEENLIKSEKLAFVGEMASVIAHEIRNSVTSIKMILQLYLESESLSDESRESFNVAMDSVLRIESIVNQLLQFAKPSPVKFESVNINSLLELSLEFAKIQFRKKRIKVVKNYDRNIPQIYADADALKEAFVNILINASQAIKKSGTIKIETKLDVFKKKITAGETKIAPGDEVVHILISDTGCGIPEENLDKIFEPFFTTKTDGTGLGLSIVKRVVGNHGGFIEAESKVNEGSTFHIYLPIKFKDKNA